MAQNSYDINDPESVRAYIEEQSRVQSKLTAETSKFGKAMNTAFDGAGKATMNFVSAISSAEKGFSKYGGLIQGLADTVGQLTSDMGVFGKSVGAAAKATAIMTEQVFAQTDRISKGFDEIADIGAQAHFTAQALRGITEAAGGSTFQMQAVGKAAKTAGAAFINVGDSVGTGMQKFGDIVTKNATGFRKLGFTFEEVFEYTGKYLQQANALGINLNRPVADLRKSSEAYMKNLVILADLTGADIKQQQAALDLAAANENIKMKIMMLEKQASDANRAGDFDTEKRIRQQVENIQTAIQGISRFDKEAQIAYLQSFASGGKVMTEYAARLQVSGLDVLKAGRDLEAGVEGTVVTANILNENTASVDKTMQRFGTGIAELGPAGIELAKTIGVSTERMTLASEQGVTGQRKNAQAALEAGKKGVDAQMGTRDALMEGVANMEAMERKFQQGLDRVIDRFNPLAVGMEDAIDSFKVLAAAAFAATYAMGIMTSAQARRNPFSNDSDRFGRRTIPGQGQLGQTPANAMLVRVINLQEICNCVGGGAMMPMGSTGMTKAQQKQYRKMRAQGMSEAQARGRILGAGGVGTGMPLPGTGGIVAPTEPQAGGPQRGRLGRLVLGDENTTGIIPTSGAGVRDRMGHMATVGGHGAAAMVGGYALQQGAGMLQSLNVVDAKGAQGLSAAGGVIGSAAQFAMMGSVFGPIGTGLGAVAGGLMGVIENYDGIKSFFSDSNDKTEESAEALERNTETQKTIDEARRADQELLRAALTANTEATKQNTLVTPGATPGADAGAQGPAPKSQEQILELINTTFADNYKSAINKWNVNQERQLSDLEAAAKKLQKDQSEYITTGFGEFTKVEQQWKSEGAKLAYEETQKRINDLKSIRDNRNKELAELRKNYEETYKQWADIQERNKILQDIGLPLSQLTMDAAASAAAGVTPGAGPRLPGGKGEYDIGDLQKMGLEVRGYGDTQKPGGQIDNRLITLSKQLQDTIPNFKYFSGFNDEWHSKVRPSSRHTRGEAVDFTLTKEPSIREGQSIVQKLKSMGFSYAQDEYNNPSAINTGGHIHAQLAEGGIVQGPKSGFPVTMHGREIVTPLEPNSILEQLGKTVGNISNIKDNNFEQLGKTVGNIGNFKDINFERSFLESNRNLLDELSKTFGNFGNVQDTSSVAFERSLGLTEDEMIKQASISDKILDKINSIQESKEEVPVDIEGINRQIAEKVESAMKNFTDQTAKSTGEYILRLDRVIDILESSNSTQEKLLRSART